MNKIVVFCFLYLLYGVNADIDISKNFRKRSGILSEDLGSGSYGQLSSELSTSFVSSSPTAARYTYGPAITSKQIVSSGPSFALPSGLLGAIALPPATITNNVVRTITQTVPIPIHHPVPVPVDKPVPYPVEVPVAVDVPRPVPVPVPHPVPIHVPKPYPVPVDRFVAVPVPQPYPVTVERHVAVPIPHPYTIPQPYPLAVETARIIVNPILPDNSLDAIKYSPSIYNSGPPLSAYDLTAPAYTSRYFHEPLLSSAAIKVIPASSSLRHTGFHKLGSYDLEPTTSSIKYELSKYH